MKLRVRLILSYTVLALVASLLLGAFYKQYTEKQHETEAFHTAQMWCEQMLNTYIDSQNQMEQATLFLLSSQEVLSSIRYLSVNMEEEETNKIDVNFEKAIVRRNINTSYNLENFYRIIVFNQYGVIAYSNNKEKKSFDTSVNPLDLWWLPEVIDTKGNFVVIGSHSDDWDTKYNNPQQVFSLVKEIQGDHLGFIEVQKSVQSLEEFLSIPGREVSVILARADGTAIYVSEHLDADKYRHYLEQEEWIAKEKNEESGSNELIAVKTSAEGDIRILLVGEWDKVIPDSGSLLNMTAVIIGAFLLFSVVFIVVTADVLTKPLRQLRDKMENCDLANIGQKIEIRSSDEDVQALTTSFQNLLERLDRSIQTEKKLTILQLQAQFDTLQAQINPHFIYNVLNTISNRGFENNDNVLCNISGNLAAMLRYSTNTIKRYVTLKEEVEYLHSYLYLQQTRFGERLQTDIQIDQDIEQEMVPKIIIQQLVENSIEHGGGDETSIRITVRGYRTDAGWRIEVLDNGIGLSKKSIQELADKMQKMKEQLQTFKSLEMEIGGMGLANTFGRMYLLYQDALIFYIDNRKTQKGAVAVIGVEKTVE